MLGRAAFRRRLGGDLAGLRQAHPATAFRWETAACGPGASGGKEIEQSEGDILYNQVSPEASARSVVGQQAGEMAERLKAAVC